MDTDGHGSDPATVAIAEVSYDLVMGPDMAFVEGTFRLHDEAWQVFIFSRRDVIKPTWTTCTWDTGVRGVVVRWPRTMPLNEASITTVLSAVYPISAWSRVTGPDSMTLR